MKILFWSIGKPHEKYIKEGVEDFTNRVSRYFKVEWLIIPPPKNAAVLGEAELKKAEAEVVLGMLTDEDRLVLLDERGKNISSEELSKLIQQKSNESTRKLVFLIGGAFGVDERISKRADFTWSLSKLVFPHMLARLILAEQVYRACTILRNEKYHHP
ncbi:MAG: m3Psi1915 methyltransferase RlmH [Chitinophagaceae bacterium]|jgi:23S rRNA (pseudouridine1915-N3)-methyltransferase|nr:m3Psi1915 methyltransferase RlmH [Chitinophagaceae bacterium]